MENKNQKLSAEQPVQQPSMQQQVVSPAKSNQSKLFLIIIFILLVTIPSGIYFLSAKNITQPKQTAIVPTTPQKSPTPTLSVDPTANWKTYTGNKYSFKYPPEWFLVTSEEYQTLYDKSPSVAGPAYTVAFNITTTQRGIIISDPVGSRKEVADKVFEEKVGNIQINGVNGARIKTEVLEGSQTDASPAIGIKVPLKEEILYIYLRCVDKECNAYKALFDQILSTFKFTDRNQTTDTSSWTPMNFEMGYTIKAPTSSGWTQSTYKARGGDVHVASWRNSEKGTKGIQVAINTFDNNTKPDLLNTINSQIGNSMVISNQSVKEAVMLDGLQIIVGPLKNKGLNYIIVYLAGGKEANASLFEQILSTFKFTN